MENKIIAIGRSHNRTLFINSKDLDNTNTPEVKAVVTVASDVGDSTEVYEYETIDRPLKFQTFEEVSTELIEVVTDYAKQSLTEKQVQQIEKFLL